MGDRKGAGRAGAAAPSHGVPQHSALWGQQGKGRACRGLVTPSAPGYSPQCWEDGGKKGRRKAMGAAARPDGRRESEGQPQRWASLVSQPRGSPPPVMWGQRDPPASLRPAAPPAAERGVRRQREPTKSSRRGKGKEKGRRAGGAQPHTRLAPARPQTCPAQGHVNTQKALPRVGPQCCRAAR